MSGGPNHSKFDLFAYVVAKSEFLGRNDLEAKAEMEKLDRAWFAQEAIWTKQRTWFPRVCWISEKMIWPGQTVLCGVMPVRTLSSTANEKVHVVKHWAIEQEFLMARLKGAV